MAHTLIEGKRFFCREWVFSKILHCLESVQRRRGDDDNAGRSGLGVLIMSGPGGDYFLFVCRYLKFENF